MVRQFKKGILLYLAALLTLTALSMYLLRTYEVPHEWPAMHPIQTKEINGVPLSIFVTWNSRHIPYYMKKHLEDLRMAHPEFSLTIYSHEECRNYIQSNYSIEVLEAYDSLVPGAYRSDLFRYCKLYKDGGVYTDIKFNINRPLLDMIQESPFHAIRDDPNEVPGCMINGFIISPPSNPVFKRCIEQIVNNCKERAYHRNALDITGPCLFGNVMNELHPTFEPKYQFSWATRKVYSLSDGSEFLTEYEYYRLEQKRHMKAIDYRDAWKEKRVYQ